jgi:hypothetical protein
MRTSRKLAASLVAALVVCLAAVAGPASAQGPAVPEVQLNGHLYPKPFGLAYVYGHYRLPDWQPQEQAAGQPVTLYAAVFPYTAWQAVGSSTTDWKGYFSFPTKVLANTAFHAVVGGSQPLQSEDLVIHVPVRVSLESDHTKARKGKRITFTGETFPPHPGLTAYLQKMDSRGKFRDVTHSALSPTGSFRARLKLERSGVFRLRVPRDADHIGGVSRAVTITVN